MKYVYESFFLRFFNYFKIAYIHPDSISKTVNVCLAQKICVLWIIIIYLARIVTLTCFTRLIM